MEPLTQQDLAKLAASGIPAELADRAQLRRVDSHEGGALIGRNGSGDYNGICFPNIAPGESRPREYRLRLDHPPLEYREGARPKEKNKYLAPPGRGNLFYFVPGTEVEWLSDTRLPIAITEGEKKCLSLWACAWDGLGDTAEKPGFVPIGFTGVWNWRGTVGKTEGPNGDRRDVKGIIPDFRRVVWKGRQVTILYDVNSRDNESVQAARSELTRELQKLGAVVSWFSWPDDTPASVNGIDDLIGLWGVDRVSKLLVSQARPVKLDPTLSRSLEKEFTAIDEGRYRFAVPQFGIVFDLDRPRRDHNELIGELAVRCELPAARTIGKD